LASAAIVASERVSASKIAGTTSASRAATDADVDAAVEPEGAVAKGRICARALTHGERAGLHGQIVERGGALTGLPREAGVQLGSGIERHLGLDLELWWPPTFTPETVSRTLLAWWTIDVASQSTRLRTGSRTSRSTPISGSARRDVAERSSPLSMDHL
jgi:hypothetical protein